MQTMALTREQIYFSHSDIMPLAESEKILKIMDAVRAQAEIVYKED